MVEKEKVVVVIDDRADWQKTISRVIRTQLNHHVETFGDSKNSLQFIDRHPFDLIVIDQRLDETVEGDESGLDLAKTIREKHHTVPIFILTGYGNIDNVAEMRRPDDNGRRVATRYIEKDDDWMDNLIAAIKDVL